MYDSEKNGALAEYLQSLHWDSFFTATFAHHQRYSNTAIDKVVSTLTEGLRFKPEKMFICAEQHRLGGWHCHGLLDYPDGGLDGRVRVGFNPNEYKDKINATELSRLGFNLVSSVNNLDAAAVYCSKYLTKNNRTGDWRMVGRKKFWTPPA